MAVGEAQEPEDRAAHLIQQAVPAGQWRAKQGWQAARRATLEPPAQTGIFREALGAGEEHLARVVLAAPRRTAAVRAVAVLMARRMAALVGKAISVVVAAAAAQMRPQVERRERRPMQAMVVLGLRVRQRRDQEQHLQAVAVGQKQEILVRAATARSSFTFIRRV